MKKYFKEIRGLSIVIGGHKTLEKIMKNILEKFGDSRL